MAARGDGGLDSFRQGFLCIFVDWLRYSGAEGLLDRAEFPLQMEVRPKPEAP